DARTDADTRSLAAIAGMRGSSSIHPPQALLVVWVRHVSCEQIAQHRLSFFQKGLDLRHGQFVQVLHRVLEIKQQVNPALVQSHAYTLPRLRPFGLYPLPFLWRQRSFQSRVCLWQEAHPHWLAVKWNILRTASKGAQCACSALAG